MTKIYHKLILSFLLVYLSASGQPGFIIGYNNFNMIHFSQTLDSGFIMIGNDQILSTGLSQIKVIKVDGSGYPEWTKSYSFSGNDVGGVILQSPDSGFIIGAISYSDSGDMDDGLIIKINSIGDTLWVKKFGFSGNDGLSFICKSSNGGYVATGLTDSLSPNFARYIMKIDDAGNIEWTRILRFTGYIRTITNTMDGGYLLAGRAYFLVPPFSGVYLGLLIKVDSNGIIQWSKGYGPQVYSSFASLKSIYESPDGRIYSTGDFQYNDTSSIFDLIVLSTDSAGNLIWANRYGGQSVDNAFFIHQTPDSNLFVAANSSSFSNGVDSYALKINTQGDTIWTRAYTGTNNGGQVYGAVLEDGSCILAGSIRALNAGPVTMIKIPPTGPDPWCSIQPHTWIYPLNTETTIAVDTLTVPMNTHAYQLTISSGFTSANLACLTSILENNEAEILVYPNPVDNKLIIENIAGRLRIQIFDIQGKSYKDFNTQSFDNKCTLDLTNLKEGLYFLLISTNEKRYQKIIIKSS